MCRKTFTYEMRTRLAGRSLVKLRDVYMRLTLPSVAVTRVWWDAMGKRDPWSPNESHPWLLDLSQCGGPTTP